MAKYTIEFITHGQDAEALLSLPIAVGGRTLPRDTIIFHTADEGAFIKGAFRSKKAAKRTVERLERLHRQAIGFATASNLPAFFIGFNIVQA